jgi:hypothetical protein
MKRSRRIAAEVWPARGVYFFPEEGEVRTETGGCPRIVCVGTHALKDGSGTKLWRRLSQHRGQASGNGFTAAYLQINCRRRSDPSRHAALSGQLSKS